jgi:uncharacterized phage protein (TIGR02218 family)
MKQASTNLITFLENTTEFVRADLYTFTLNGGGVLRYCGANLPITAVVNNPGGVGTSATWNLGPPISDAGVQSSRGVNAATVDLTILGGDGRFTVSGEDILDFIENFGLDGASARIDRAWAASWSDMYTQGPVGTHCRFAGYVSEAKELGQTQAVVTIASWLDVLQTPYPSEVFQTSCLNVFCDAKCGLNLASFTQVGHVVGATDQATFNMDLTVADGFFNLGVVTFTSGPNAGVSRSVKYSSAAGNGVKLTAPLPAVPAAGDSFTVSQGCALSMSACQNFNNLSRFRGTPFIPPPTTGLPS